MRCLSILRIAYSYLFFTTTRLSHSLIGSKMVIRSSLLLSTWIDHKQCWGVLWSSSEEESKAEAEEEAVSLSVPWDQLGRKGYSASSCLNGDISSITASHSTLYSPQLRELLSCALLVTSGPCKNYAVPPAVLCHVNTVPALSLMLQSLPACPPVCVVMLEFSIKTS